MMKFVTKLACVAALAPFAVGATAHAAVDDNYPWSQPGGTLAPMSMLSRANSGKFGYSGGLTISSSTDVDYYLLSCGTEAESGTSVFINSVTVEFTHSKGDLDIVVYGVEGNVLGSSSGMVNNETVVLTSAKRNTAVLQVRGCGGDTNYYSLTLDCM